MLLTRKQVESFPFVDNAIAQLEVLGDPAVLAEIEIAFLDES
jgi:hypothetical protein